MRRQTAGFSITSVVFFGVLCAGMAIGISPLLAEDTSTIPLSAWIKSQTDKGLLTLDFYVPGKPRQFDGWTQFEFRIDFQYECQVKWPQKKPRRGPVVLLPSFTSVDVPITHKIELPVILKSDRWYEAGLARHELEHVRVGTHPRLVMLCKHLVNKLNRIERTVDKPEDVKPEWVKEQVESELLPRKDAMHKLVMDINAKIDKSTNHGARAIAQREQFLSELYTKKQLDELKFPYLGQVLDLVDTKDYLAARVQVEEIDSVQTTNGK